MSDQQNVQSVDYQLAAIAHAAVKEALASMAPEESLPDFEELSDSEKFGWQLAVIGTRSSQVTKGIEIPVGHHSAKAAWEVVGGLIPNKPEPEFTKRWGLTSDENASPVGPDIFTKRMIEAMQYFTQLNHPQRLNWASIHWIWF